MHTILNCTLDREINPSALMTIVYEGVQYDEIMISTIRRQCVALHSKYFRGHRPQKHLLQIHKIYVSILMIQICLTNHLSSLQ